MQDSNGFRFATFEPYMKKKENTFFKVTVPAREDGRI